ncbi:MAG: hypothetical protein K1X74_03955 [Pirellulales bacterium]|nr:hypothetical protein [Pirellulales bacterium]
MPRPEANPTPRAAQAAVSTRSPLGPWSKAVISVAVTLHLVGVFCAPFALPPASELSGRLWEVYRPYLEAMFLNHGYAFFAPDPGPSHLVRYVLEYEDGHKEEHIFPNLSEHKPRLLYHRHFMLSEFLNAAPPETPWVQAYIRSYAAHLLAHSGAKRVTIYLRRHLLPSPGQVLEGAKLDDPRSYEERDLGTFDAQSAAEPVAELEVETLPLGAPRQEQAPGQPPAAPEPPL